MNEWNEFERISWVREHLSEEAAEHLIPLLVEDEGDAPICRVEVFVDGELVGVWTPDDG